MKATTVRPESSSTTVFIREASVLCNMWRESCTAWP